MANNILNKDASLNKIIKNILETEMVHFPEKFRSKDDSEFIDFIMKIRKKQHIHNNHYYTQRFEDCLALLDSVETLKHQRIKDVKLPDEQKTSYFDDIKSKFDRKQYLATYTIFPEAEQVEEAK